MCLMDLRRSLFLFCFIIACSCATETTTMKQIAGKENGSTPATVNSRFFDFGGIFNQLFPGLNQGIQGGPGGDSSGMGYPDNSQFNPQGFNPDNPSMGFPLDDASHYPNPGYYDNPQQNPNQGNFGGIPQQQYPDQGNFGGSQQQYPDQGNFGGSPQYPNQGDFGNRPQYPDMGNFGRPQQQYPDQGNFGNPRPVYPDQGNFGGPQQQYPGQDNFGTRPQYPQGNFGRPQGGFNNQPGSMPGGDGTLDSIVPPDEDWNNGPINAFPNQPNEKPIIPDDQYPGQDLEGGGSNAILGNPVIVPPATPPGEDQIIFPSSTENPFQKQCVQDCNSTSEYNPVCGSNNVTYFNPGKFVCARNCGIKVFVSQQGRCPGDTQIIRPPPKVANNN